MTLDELADVLDHAADIDPRFQPTIDLATAWLPMLAGIDKTAALAAVDAHYARSSARLMPSDIRRVAGPRSREQWLV
jgi:hypothetical protein